MALESRIDHHDVMVALCGVSGDSGRSKSSRNSQIDLPWTYVPKSEFVPLQASPEFTLYAITYVSLIGQVRGSPSRAAFPTIYKQELSQTTVEGRDDRPLTRVVLRCVQSGLLSTFPPRIQRKR